MTEAVVIAILGVIGSAIAGLLTAVVAVKKADNERKAEERRTRTEDRAQLRADLMAREQHLWNQSNTTISRQIDELSRVRSAHDSLLEELREVRAHLSATRSENREMEGQIRRLQVQVEGLQESNRELLQQVRMLTVQQAESRTRQDKIRADLDVTIDAYRADMSGLKSLKRSYEEEFTG
ncbi:MAG: hypothetical protein AAFY15_13830 [Cyanobacteria bacterium J06648_11]